MTEIGDWQGRNARLRGQIDRFFKSADRLVQEKVKRIASEPIPHDLLVVETLKWVNDNLRRRANALVDSGVALPNDFEAPHT
jgi:hypothetical protein